jgi:hypothetical protein
VVLVPPGLDAGALARQLRMAAARPAETLVRCTGDAQQVLRWQPQVAGTGYPNALRSGGVYLITGGLGGLGLLFAREILTGAPSATVVLTGRAALEPAQRAKLDVLAADCGVPAARLAYRQLDLGSRDGVAATVAAIVA